jgi:hypothetical protein
MKNPNWKNRILEARRDRLWNYQPNYKKRIQAKRRKKFWNALFYWFFVFISVYILFLLSSVLI